MIIQLKNIEKKYQVADQIVPVLVGIDLEIQEGEMVAIMGPSGSGKSTLMNIIGLLDTPSQGDYKLTGKAVSSLSEKELSELRRDTIGFIFQQFNLLSRMTALENVQLPLMYSGKLYQIDIAASLLSVFGLESRLHYRPNQLSGGQQQRIAVARALVNHPKIILADEPTGNLDSKSKDDVMKILSGLNAKGFTVIIVTHEEEVSRRCKRVVRIRDGRIEGDEQILQPSTTLLEDGLEHGNYKHRSRFSKFVKQSIQALKMLSANKIRTALSVLGILIGVASVVAMLALGRGAQAVIERQLSSLGSNLLVLRPGAIRGEGGAVLEAGAATRLSMADADDIRNNVDHIVNTGPSVSGRVQLTAGNKNWNTQVYGVSPSYEQIRASTPTVGRFFTDAESRERKRVLLLGTTVAHELFGNRNPIGENIRVNRLSFQVIGVLPEKSGGGFRDQNDMIAIPITTAMHRLLGKDYIDALDIQVSDPAYTDEVIDQVEKRMNKRHKIAASQSNDAFQIRNMADIQAALSTTTRTMTMLLSLIAAVSLLVGGIGIMNIMLVSVAERTREIGLRKAIGARKVDILYQFLIESIVLSLLGGFAGIALAWLITFALARFAGWATQITTSSILLGFAFSVSVGVLFGFYPAQKASKLHPIDALRFE